MSPTITISGPGLSITDYIVLIGTVVFSILIGVYYAVFKKQKTNSDLLVGGRDMAVVPVALSLLATYVSATIILDKWTGEIYANGAIIAEIILVALIFIPLGGILFLPTIFKLNLTSAYEYLELRFNSRVVRLIATITFSAQIILYMGVVLYAPCLGLNAVTGIPVEVSVLAVGLSGAVYTSIGGYKAVVATDVFQMFIMFAGLLAVVIHGVIKLGGFENVFHIAREHGRMEFLNFEVDPFLRHTSLNIFFGQGAMWLSGYGVHQCTVQRYCSMSSYKKALTAMLITAPLVGLAMLLTVLSGIVVFSNYAGCDPITLNLIEKKDQVLPYYVLENLSSTPGLVGLFTACLLSGALSTISSGLNSLAAVLWEDVLKDRQVFATMSEPNQALVVKIVGFTYGILTIGMAFIAGSFSGILAAALVIFGAASGPILGVFILGIFIPFVNKYGAGIGMISGQIVAFGISIGALLWAPKPVPLEYSIDECPNEVWEKLGTNMTSFLDDNQRMDNGLTNGEMDEWPYKIFTISYLLYTLIGAITTVVVGIVICLFTGMTKYSTDLEPFIHPIFRILRKIIEDFSSGDNRRRKTYKIPPENDMTNNGSSYPLSIPMTHSKQNLVTKLSANGVYKKRYSKDGKVALGLYGNGELSNSNNNISKDVDDDDVELELESEHYQHNIC